MLAFSGMLLATWKWKYVSPHNRIPSMWRGIADVSLVRFSRMAVLASKSLNRFC